VSVVLLLRIEVDPNVNPPIFPVVELISPVIFAALAVILPEESTLNVPLPIFNVPPVIVPPVIVGEFIVNAAFIVPAFILFASKLRINALSIYTPVPSTLNGTIKLSCWPRVFTILNRSA